MTRSGSQLYDLYCEGLSRHWSPVNGMLIFTAAKNPTEPKAWAFLTDTERAAWNDLASELVL